jgi:hypothetical protein
MSYLDNNDLPIANVHPAAQQVREPTIMQTSGPATSSTPGIETGGRSVTIMATNPGMEERAKHGPAIQSQGPGLSIRATDVMVRSANQDGRQTGTPNGFVWGLQGVGEEPKAAPGMPTWAKIGLFGLLGVIAWKTLKPRSV